MKDQAGFTLIEIMVVVVIIAIATTFAVVSFTRAAETYHARYKVDSWVALLRQSVARAILRREYIGLSINRKGVQWYQMQWDLSHKWRWVSWRGPDGMTGSLASPGISMKCSNNNSDDPQMIITSAGRATSCVLTFRTNRKVNTIRVSINGDVVLQ